MKMERVLITPEMATEWLSIAAPNRQIRESKVIQYAEDMEAGLWRETHQGIALDPDGRVVDGQHRLRALELAKVSLWFWVGKGLTADDVLAVDTGRPRIAADSISIKKGRGVSYREAAVARALAPLKSGQRRNTLSVAIVEETLDRYQEAIDFAKPIMFCQTAGLANATVGAIFARLYFHPKRHRVERLMEILVSGLPGGDPAAAIAIKLRDYLRNEARGERTGFGSIAYGKIEQGAASFIKESQGSKLYAATEELFPLPHEGEEPAVPRGAKIRKIREGRQKAGALGGRPRRTA